MRSQIGHGQKWGEREKNPTERGQIDQNKMREKERARERARARERERERENF